MNRSTFLRRTLGALAGLAVAPVAAAEVLADERVWVPEEFGPYDPRRYGAAADPWIDDPPPWLDDRFRYDPPGEWQHVELFQKGDPVPKSVLAVEPRQEDAVFGTDVVVLHGERGCEVRPRRGYVGDGECLVRISGKPTVARGAPTTWRAHQWVTYRTTP